MAEVLACCAIEIEDEMALVVRSGGALSLNLAAPHVVCAAHQAQALLLPQASGGLIRLDLGLLPADVLRRLWQRLRSSSGVNYPRLKSGASALVML